MKVLGIGGGGRESSIGWKLAESPHIKQMWWAPGNPGIAGERLASNGSLVECVNIGAEDIMTLLQFASEKKPDLTVVSSDGPLALGIVDVFQKAGLRIWGPNKKASKLEWSKIYSQEFMTGYGIPTPEGGWCYTAPVALAFARRFDGNCFVKLDGLALGKGALPCKNVPEAQRIILKIFDEKNFGKGGEGIVIQKRVLGKEISLHLVCDGTNFNLFPISRDYKTVGIGDEKNTGGMGAFCPVTIPKIDITRIVKFILEPWVAGCLKEGIEFKGILYPSIMLTSDGPQVLEFNARFGDPETQVYLTRMETDLLEVIEASLAGTIDKVKLMWKPETSVCVVMASGGYPDSKTVGKVITGLDEVDKLPNTKVFHAGTTLNKDGDVVTSGGRVLGVTSWAIDLETARKQAYLAVEKIKFETAWCRPDIGQ